MGYQGEPKRLYDDLPLLIRNIGKMLIYLFIYLTCLCRHTIDCFTHLRALLVLSELIKSYQSKLTALLKTDSVDNFLESLAEYDLAREEKMAQGWVVYGGMRHAEPQREMFPRSYTHASPALAQLELPRG